MGRGEGGLREGLGGRGCGYMVDFFVDGLGL